MRIAVIDPFAGISGDMTLGALVDAGAGEQWLESLPSRLGLDHVAVRVERVERAGLAATKVSVAVESAGGGAGRHGRHVGKLIDMVKGAPLSDRVKGRAIDAFELIGAAEGRAHGVPPGSVHLHEVGAADALLDIVGAIEGFERLQVGAIYNLPVAVGDGWVEAAHGHLPVPAPATLYLLEGCELRTWGPVAGEATTPTGAALLRVLSNGPPPESWRVTSSHWGAGHRDPETYPNALRLILAEGAPEAGVIEIVATDLDDLQPEYIEPLRQAVLDAGALDCMVWPTQGKKGRVSIRLEALTPPEAADSVAQALFTHSTTAGIRRWTALRNTLPRHEVSVELERAISVRVKV
ncbi:MAG: nickel pincer cofactor biosynthesis protein LarC [Gemmatimonadales bacterium]